MDLGWTQERGIHKKIEYFFIFFILLQPFLDLLAYFHIPISLPIRLLVMIIGIIYLFIQPNTKVKWISIVYLFLLGAVLLIGFVNNFLNKDPFSLVEELTFIIKTAYFIEMLLVYVFVFLSLNSRIDWQRLVQRNVFIAMTVIAIVMLLATLTGTGKLSYSYPEKQGHSGWFYSANELSAAMAIALGIAVLYVLAKKGLLLKIVFTAILLFIVWSMMVIGTKVALGAAVGILGLALIISVFEGIFTRKNLVNIPIMAVLLVMTVLIIPYTPIGNNVNTDLLSKVFTGNQNAPGGQDDTSDQQEKIRKANDQAIQKELLSDRNKFLKIKKQQFKSAPITQKLFGMGYGGNDKKAPKQIEMDFFDWFYDFGIIGFIMLVLPLFFIAIRIIKNILQARFRTLNRNALIVGAEAVIGLGGAFVAGHTVTAPAAGIYLALMIGYLFSVTRLRENN